jgi:hypothetical protein
MVGMTPHQTLAKRSHTSNMCHDRRAAPRPHRRSLCARRRKKNAQKRQWRRADARGEARVATIVIARYVTNGNSVTCVVVVRSRQLDAASTQDERLLQFVLLSCRKKKKKKKKKKAKSHPSDNRQSHKEKTRQTKQIQIFHTTKKNRKQKKKKKTKTTHS